MADALRILLPVANHWQTIGTLMHIPPDILENIRTREREEPIKCLMAMLTKLVTLTDPTPTWKALAEAVEPINQAKAKEIRDSYVGRGQLLASQNPGMLFRDCCLVFIQVNQMVQTIGLLWWLCLHRDQITQLNFN